MSLKQEILMNAIRSIAVGALSLALMSLVIALISAVGLLYDIPILTTWFLGYPPISMPASVAIASLSIAVILLASRRKSEHKDKP